MGPSPPGGPGWRPRERRRRTGRAAPRWRPPRPRAARYRGPGRRRSRRRRSRCREPGGRSPDTTDLLVQAVQAAAHHDRVRAGWLVVAAADADVLEAEPAVQVLGPRVVRALLQEDLGAVVALSLLE